MKSRVFIGSIYRKLRKRIIAEEPNRGGFAVLHVRNDGSESPGILMTQLSAGCSRDG